MQAIGQIKCDHLLLQVILTACVTPVPSGCWDGGQLMREAARNKLGFSKRVLLGRFFTLCI